MKVVENTVTETQTLNSNADQFREELAKIHTQDTPNENAAESETGHESETNNNNEVVEKEDGGESRDNSSTDSMDSSSDNDEDYEDDSVNGMIPRGRLNKAIERRKELEAQWQQEREERIRIETQNQMLLKALENLNQNTSQKQEQNFEPEIDPLDHEAHAYYMNEIKQTKEMLMRQEESRKQDEYRNSMGRIMYNQEVEFSNQHPDFKDAYDYLLGVQVDLNRNIYNSEQAQQVAVQSLGRMAENAIHSKQNAAAILYEAAKRCGYPGKAISEPKSNISAINNNMKKSAVADVNSASLPLANARSNVATREVFEKKYEPGNPDSFYALLKALKNGS